MATLDMRGARFDIRVAPPNGVHHAFAFKQDSTTPRSLTGATVTAYLADDGADSVTSYVQTVTDTANGEFTLIIPASAFDNLWGKQATYVVNAQYAAESAPTPLLYGIITVLEKT